jgi:arylformamidase
MADKTSPTGSNTGGSNLFGSISVSDNGGYGGLSQAELDEQFSLDYIPNLEDVRRRRDVAATEVLEAFPANLNIAYGEYRDEKLNIFPAQNRRSALAPVHVFIHGGFWRSMKAWQFSSLATGFVPFGAALIVIDYPLMPAVRLHEVVESCRKAISWIYRHGREYSLDPDRIFISGNSAGGHLVAEMMDRTWIDRFQLPQDVIKGGTAISGLYDLRPVVPSFQNNDLKLREEEVSEFSPLLRELDIKAPLISTVGGLETREFLRQTAEFAAHVARTNPSVEHLVVPDTDHITVVLDAMSDPDNELNRAVRKQMAIG